MWGQVALLRFLLISSRGSSGVLYMGSQPSACPLLSFSCNPFIPVLDTDWCHPCHADFKVSYSFITRWSTDTDLLLNSSQLHWNQISACFFFFFSFNWRIIVSQCCVGSHCMAMWISHKWTYTLLSWMSLPPHPTYPSRLSQSTGLSSLCYQLPTSYPLDIWLM